MFGISRFFFNRPASNTPENGFVDGRKQRLRKKKAHKQNRRVKNRQKKTGQTPPFNPMVRFKR
jgi:hypothetical protein